MAQTRPLKLRYTRPALSDLRNILDYVAAQSPQAATCSARIKTIIDLLLLHPYLGRRTSDPTIRRLAVTPYPYLIFYEISETEIIIHALRHTARDPSNMPGSG